MSDAEIGSRFDSPVDSPPLEDIVGPRERVLLVVPDATRRSGAGQIVNLLVRRLIANGGSPSDINIIFATGIHRAVTPAEKLEIITPFVAQRISTLDHDAGDPVRNFRVGATSGGLHVELNWLLTEFDHIVLIGGITFHYFAGFTGGRKLICPGLASERTIDATHRLAFDCENGTRRSGVGTGLLDGNPVHQVFQDAAGLVKPAFAVNSIINDAGKVADVYCGHWISSHRTACDAFAAANSVEVKEKRRLVVASCGGHPLDINMIQAHKAIEAASAACTEGGKIILLAECPDGLGRHDLLKWFNAGSSDELAKKLCSGYQVNGQTAWSLLQKAERFDIRIVTSIDGRSIGRMRMTKIAMDEALNAVATASTSGYILPAGARIRVTAN